MPQPSYEYAGARIASLEKRLLDRADILRMAEGTLQDALRMLMDVRYGGVSDLAEMDVEQMIANELNNAATEVKELSPESEITDLLFLKNDILNLKQLIKARLLNQSDIEWQGGGLFSREQLTYCVQNADYKLLPPVIQSALNKLEKQLAIAVEPQRISIELDRAYLEYALMVSGKNGFLRHYFMAEADFDNLLSFLRMRAMGAGKESFKDVLLPEGGIKHKNLLNSYELSFDAINRVVSESVCKDAILEGLNRMQQTGNIGQIERARDDYLLSLFKNHKHERTTLYPIIGFYLAKEREAKAIRLIITVKRNGLKDDVIAGRLVEQYG